ncbi:uncharacterized protein LOC108732558 [Agrilus planipennis]|uniref:Uncharacterized protein LOC108732558 n=1 Tax=Agrilus planipennis TaxID=224129 RepID=A0A7F5R795_AGRPL|nr:uncharacterized protein LOC108732558 [Agrilus planipennis]
MFDRYKSKKVEDDIELKAIVTPAPLILKPFAGLYKPYPYGCSLLCNHPRNSDSKELVKRARDAWATEGKNILLVEEVQAIRNNLEQFRLNPNENTYSIINDEIKTTIDSVPEELFRRYTDTDSRPLTPAPTLASAYTRASGSRRCITPDPTFNAEIKEKTMLILDLRRSHSQETLSWYGSSLYHETPLIKIFPAPLADGGGGSLRSTRSLGDDNRKKLNKTRSIPPGTKYKDKRDKALLDVVETKKTAEDAEKNQKGAEDEEPLKRRGKRRKKKGRDSSKGPPAFQSSLDPETQVEDDIELKAIVTPAPLILKPFAGLYKPYPYGCSLLCNHPRNSDSKELVKRARDAWATEGKNILLVEEVQAIRNNLEQFRLNPNENTYSIINDEIKTTIDSVPEELFRRYTDTDSRPLTPAPTLASAYTRASGSRRCITPDPTFNAEIKEKTMLILDLRRSHSQETLSWYGSSLYHETPLIKIFPAPLADGGGGSLRSTRSLGDDNRKKLNKTRSIPPGTKYKDKRDKALLDVVETKKTAEDAEKNQKGAEDEEPLKRRGKRRKKKGRDSSKGPPAFQSSLDPETQISAIGQDSGNPSKRPSVSLNDADIGNANGTTTKNSENVRKSSLDVDSFLDKDVLKHLRRQLNEEIVDCEFDKKKRRALQEALKTVNSQKKDCEKLQKLKEELNLPPTNTEFILSLPRMFSRSSARFELPMDSRTFETLTPLEYLRDNVVISSARKLLYKCVFNKHRPEDDIGQKSTRRVILGKDLPRALNETMSKKLSDIQEKKLKELLEWKDDEEYDFQTFCGVSALCERLLAPELAVNFPSREEDPCHELEKVDFESLSRRLDGMNAKSNLVKILYAIKDL